MSKLFFDHLIKLDEVEVEIKKVTKTQEEREELWQIVDEIQSWPFATAVFIKSDTPGSVVGHVDIITQML